MRLILILISMIFIPIFAKADYKKNYQDDTTNTYIKNIIREVNSRAALNDSIQSDNIVKINTNSFNETASFRIKLLRNKGIFLLAKYNFFLSEREVFRLNINNQDFVYYNLIDDKVIKGPTNSNNISAIGRIDCSYNDLLNAFSGAAFIDTSFIDSVSVVDSSANVTLKLFSGNSRTEYGISKNNFYVLSYSRYNNDVEYYRVHFKNLRKNRFCYYAGVVDIRVPKKSQFLKIINEDFLSGVKNINLEVVYPSDAKIIKWKN